MQVAEKIIEAIKDSDKQEPPLRAVTQYDKVEILKASASQTKVLGGSLSWVWVFLISRKSPIVFTLFENPHWLVQFTYGKTSQEKVSHQSIMGNYAVP